MANSKFNLILAPYMPPEVVAGIRATIASLYEQVKPYTDELGPQQRRELAKMGDGSVAWVGRVEMHLNARPEMCPVFVDREELRQNLESVKVFEEFEAALTQIISLMSGTSMGRGAAAYNAALAGYDAFKAGAKRNVQGMSAIVADLAPQFAGRRPRGTDPGSDGSDGGAASS